MLRTLAYLPSLCLMFTLAAPLEIRAAATNGETLAVAGLTQPVEIVKDHWGISHIYAKNEGDLFFAQGYNVARDRLFQLELWRRQATGTVAEILGHDELKRDIGNRLFQFRGDLTQELTWYHPHGVAIVDSFVRGLNAYIEETRRNPALLTPEFRMLGIVPGKWTPEVVITRFNGLFVNIEQEMNTALAVRTLGVDKVKELTRYQPADPKLDMDPAIDQSLLSTGILELYHAFRRPIEFTPKELVAQGGDIHSRLAMLDHSVNGPTSIDLSQRQEDIGSNNWVVGGALTMSGFPLLMNDPHRVQQVPSLRYWVHLVAPGWNVLGAGEPALPGVSIGHNERGGWGFTTFGSDTEDLYVYDTNPANSGEYKYNGRWEAMTVIKDSIPVKGGSSEAVDLKYTRHGPVLFEDKLHHKAYALRAAWREVGGAPYLAGLRMDQAHNWEEFLDACTYSRLPAENFVWADLDRNFGYQAVGISPLRPNWSGLVPVPGDGRYEWDGYLPIRALPHVLNPAKGFWNTSNNFLIPTGWPYKDALHYVWADPYRAASVYEFLSSNRRFTLSDMIELQMNDLSIPARTLVPLLHDLPAGNPVSQEAQALLLHWDYLLGRDSVPAGIYEMWQRYLQINVRELMVPTEARAFIGMPQLSLIIDWLQAPDGRFGPDPIAGRNALLIKSMDEAVTDLTKRLGPKMELWKLGAYHHATIHHLLTGALTAEQRTKFDVGEMPRGGDSYTVSATGGEDNQTTGASFKMLLDTENWDNSVGVNNPGQSGDVNNPHYRDLNALWGKGKYFPIFYSRDKINSVAEKVTVLEPAK